MSRSCATPVIFLIISTALQEGAAHNTSSSARTPSLGIVRTCFMVSPQERHTRVGVQSTAPAHSGLHRRPFLGGYVDHNIREPRTR